MIPALERCRGASGGLTPAVVLDCRFCVAPSREKFTIHTVATHFSAGKAAERTRKAVNMYI